MSKGNIEIKTHECYTVSHFNFIANIFIKERNDVLQYLYEEIHPTIVDKGIIRTIITDAKVGKQIVGSCLSYIWKEDNTNFHISYFAIDPMYRDSKIGALMLKDIEKDIKVLNIGIKSISLYVSIENFNAIGLYIKQGFKIVEFIEKGYNARIGYYLMKKDL